MPANTVSVTRPGKWGNPFSFHPEEGGNAEAVKYFREWLDGKWPGTEPERRAWILENIQTLKGKNLACYCPLDKPCHADVLIGLANRSEGRLYFIDGRSRGFESVRFLIDPQDMVQDLNENRKANGLPGKYYYVS